MTETKLPIESELPELELWLPDIKKYTKKNLAKLFKSAGYKFRRSDFSFRRKHHKHFEEFSFNFFSRFPLNYRVNFLLQVWNHDVKVVKDKFPHKSKIENYKLRSLVLFMPEFLDPADRSLPDQPGIKEFLLITNEDLFNAVDSIQRMLQDRAIPTARLLSSLDGLDRYFASRPGWSVNTLNLNNMSTELIAAKLNGKRDFAEVHQRMLQHVDKKIESKEMSPDVKDTLDLYCDYLTRGV